MTEQRKHFPEFYVTAPQPCPYLSGRLERKLFTHLTHDKAPALVDNLFQIFIAPLFLAAEVFFALGYKPALHAAVQARATKMRSAPDATLTPAA